MNYKAFGSVFVMIVLLAMVWSFTNAAGSTITDKDRESLVIAAGGNKVHVQATQCYANYGFTEGISIATLINAQSGRIFYVDQTDGKDSNSGNTPSTAWKNCPGMEAYTGLGTLQPGNIVYFNSSDTWLVTGNQGIHLIGGVTYIGDSWGLGKRAEIRAITDLAAGVVRFRDHATIPTVFKGFNVNANKMVATGIDINHSQGTLMNGATKRVENCEVHNVWSRTSLRQYKYGIIISNFGGPGGYCENVEIINCKVHDISRDIICLYPSDKEGSRIRNITVRGCEVYNSGQDPDYGAGSGICIKGFVVDAFVEYNYVHDVKAAGLFINGNETRHYPGIGPKNIHLRYNIVGNNTPHGAIRLHDGRSGSDPKDVKIYGNIIYGNPFNLGLVMFSTLGDTNKLWVYNNTFYNAPVIIDCPRASFPVFEFMNNVAFYSAGPPIIGADRFTVFSNNLTDKPFFINTSELPTGFTGTYGVDMAPNTNGLALPGTSPGIDGGASLPDPYQGSINTLVRPVGRAWDIGAYENPLMNKAPVPIGPVVAPALTNDQPEGPLAPLPEGPGLAARYPADRGIARDPAVVFTENFEGYKGQRISSSEKGDWDTYYGDLVITRTTENVNLGKQALQVTHIIAPKAHGAVKEVAGYDTLFVRFYMKFHPQFPEVHHTGMYIRGGQKGALLDNPTGTRPTGEDHFNAALDHLFPSHGASPPENKTSPGWTYNYCYHMDQPDRFGEILLSSGTINGSKLLGPQFVPRPNTTPERDRWYCFEIMIQCNTPGSRNGRVGIWRDGILIADHPNLRFRTVESLKARYVTLSTYASSTRPNQVLWYDDIVAATQYIGPIAGKSKITF